MQRLYIAVILLLSVSLSSFAGTPAATTDAPGFAGIANFNKTFPQAVITDYKSKGELTEVNFVWNGLKLIAFYSKQGDLVATCRTMELSNLPVTAQLKLKETYPNYILREAIEYDDTNNGMSYYVNVVYNKSTLLLQISADGTISVFKKMRN
jgi:hypothetical protein